MQVQAQDTEAEGPGGAKAPGRSALSINQGIGKVLLPPSCSFLPSYSHRVYSYGNEDVLLVNQRRDIEDLMRLNVRREDTVIRRLTVATAKGCGDALVRIINGNLSYGLILCPFEPRFVEWARLHGYPGAIVAMAHDAPLTRSIAAGFDACIKRLDVKAMNGLVKLLGTVIAGDKKQAASGAESPASTSSPKSEAGSGSAGSEGSEGSEDLN